MRAHGADQFPVILAGNVAVPFGGAVATPNADDLQNDFQRDIEIEEIRFLLSINARRANATPGDAVTVFSMGALGGLVRAQLKMGRLDLTNGYVPVWLLGTRYQLALEQVTGFYNATNLAVWEYYRWKLPKPVVVPHGSTLMTTFQFVSPTGVVRAYYPDNSAITVWVAMAGRSLPRDFELPATLKVPYASAWVPRPSLGAVAGEAQSGNDVLLNKFGKPINVQRFIGRGMRTIGGDTVADALLPTDSEVWAENTAGLPALSLRGSDGYDVVRDLTPWTDVFQPARCALEAGVVLPPLSWYTVRLAFAPFLPAGGSQYLVEPMISMVGWREEELAL